MASVGLLVAILVLYSCSQETTASFLGRPLLYGPTVALEGAIEEFNCEVLTRPEEEAILFNLFRVDERSKVLGFYTALEGEMATMVVIVHASTHEGYLECVARVQNNTEVRPTVSARHYLRVVDPVKGANVTVQSGALESFEGGMLTLSCNVTSGNHVTYDWLIDDKPLPRTPLHYTVKDQLLIYRTSLADSGEYVCVATNKLNDTTEFTSRSEPVVVKVKVHVSNPDISFVVTKEVGGAYAALVTCRSASGTPPITFSLYNRSELVTEEMVARRRNVTFVVPLVLDRHLGWLQCRAENRKNRTAYSGWMDLNVVSVRGPAEIRYDHHVAENFAVVGLAFSCSVPRGTFVRYRWFLNGTLLAGRGEFYLVADQSPARSVLVVAVATSSAGTYRCEASDAFDNATAVRSRELYMDKEVLNRLPTAVTAAVLGLFFFLVALVTACCCMALAYRQKPYGEKSLLDLEMIGVVVSHAYDGEDVDEEDYEEDVAVVRAARISESDEASLESLDEW